MSLFKITVQSSGGDLGALPVCPPRPKPVCYSTLENLGAGPEAEAAAQDGVEDILGDILSITAAQEAEKQERERKAAGSESDPGFDIQTVSKLLSAISPEILPFAQKLIALAVEGDKLLNILGANPADILLKVRLLLEWLSKEVARELGVDVDYTRYLLEQMVEEPLDTLVHGFGYKTDKDGDIVIVPRIELDGDHPLESIRFSVLQGKVQVGAASIAEKDEFRIMLEERASETNRGEHRRYQLKVQYNRSGGRQAADSFFNSLSGPRRRQISPEPMEMGGEFFLKGISAYGMALNANWRSATKSLPHAVAVDIETNVGTMDMKKKFKYDE